MPKASTEIPISKDVQIPERRGAQYARYPFAKLEVGDSFAFDASATRSHITGAMRHARTANPNCAFATRAVHENGATIIRVWRTK